MCSIPSQPKVVTPTIRRLAAPSSEAAQRQADFEQLIRRTRSPMADVLTTPLGLVGAEGQK
jgi:hypothetical protein